MHRRALRLAVAVALAATAFGARAPRVGRVASASALTPRPASAAPAIDVPVTPAPSTAATTSARVADKTGGAAVLLEGATVSIGDADLITGANLRVGVGERWGLVGVNGAGKSTIMKAILRNDPRFAARADSIAVRDGTIAISQTLSVGYLEQTAVTGSDRTVKEEVMSRMDRLVAARTALERASDAVSRGDISDAAVEALADAEAAFSAAGGYDSDKLVAGVLRGLGFTDADHERACSEFSGGWRMRIALARLLLSSPELLLLDEPSNHLDSSAKRWLGNYLKSYDGTLLLVSHDESILAAAVTSIAEVDSATRTIESFKSMSLEQWRVEREARKARRATEDERRQAEIDRLQSFVDRFGAKATKATAAKSKEKAIERIRAAAPPSPDASFAAEGGGSQARKLVLRAAAKSAVRQLELRGASFGWTCAPAGADGGGAADGAEGCTPDVGGVPLLRDVHLKVERGWRLAVVGPNGAGKSTLLAAISGALPLAAGTREVGDGVVLGVFRQDLAQDLDQAARPVDLVQRAAWEHDGESTVEDAFGALGALGLSGARASGRTIGQLSGGEKARVALATFSVKPHNLLLLDEPTNHIDAQMAAVLVDALRDFPGGVITVSHDRAFVEAIEPTHVVSVRDGRVRMEERALRDDDWVHPDAAEASDATAQQRAPVRAAAAAAAAAAAPARGDDKAQRKARTAAEKSAKALERRMDKLAQDVGALEASLAGAGSDYTLAARLQAQIDATNAELDATLVEWEAADKVANAPQGEVPS
ncbi:hypothetical protein KFE25_002322 [Diacronema lutheri]|uniref:ABC transporter domain-containing protein n=2 Tax=Diacronema lutheri TaxID=2081491 RepID=A0A8J6C7H4_DIALT|nr:hypothetical protein KFE25_002322 [Diacronema lutheri]